MQAGRHVCRGVQQWTGQAPRVIHVVLPTSLLLQLQSAANGGKDDKQGYKARLQVRTG